MAFITRGLARSVVFAVGDARFQLFKNAVCAGLNFSTGPTPGLFTQKQ